MHTEDLRDNLLLLVGALHLETSGAAFGRHELELGSPPVRTLTCGA